MSIFKKNKKYDYGVEADNFAPTENYPTSPPECYKSCTTCGCLIAVDRQQEVGVQDTSEAYPRYFNEYYCAIHALPYDYKTIKCLHETNYFQYSTLHGMTQVRGNGKPLPKAKV